MMIRNLVKSGVVILVALPLLAFAATASAESRDATLEMLRAISTGRESEAVRIRVNDGAGGPIRIGDELVYRFETDAPGYLTAIHVDTHGSVTLLYPRPDVDAGRLDPGRPILLPSDDDGFALTAQPPIGRDVVYAIVTETPLTRRSLGLESRDIVVSFEPHQAPAFVRRLRDVLDARSANETRIAHLEQQVDGRGEVQYRSADIVGFFGERTRSIRPAKLDLQIQFAVDSATLDDGARRNIDEFARALEDPRLRDMRFKVAGHTDDRGSEGHNMGLSERRAETVRRYLVEQGGIDSSRLEIEAHGETKPLMPESSDYARRMNRRVEFTPAR
jgi:outer membrane protein OmpA-like peptidoglycan-associated protein